MYGALEIAKYVINKCTEDGCTISNLQLQKILYYIQKEFLTRDKIAFLDDIQAWQFGPVVPNVYGRYCMYGSMRIEEHYSVQISNCDKKIIDEVIVKKRAVFPWDLVDETHKRGGAWDRVYKDGFGNRHVIPRELIKKVG